MKDLSSIQTIVTRQKELWDDILKNQEEIKKLNVEVVDRIFKLFVSKNYSYQKMEFFKTIEGLFGPSNIYRVVYYPVLEIPKGYKIVNNRYDLRCEFSELDDNTLHVDVYNTFEIVDQNESTISFKCNASLCSYAMKSSKGIICLKYPNYIVNMIEYEVEAFGKTYTMKRKFDLNDFIMKNYANKKAKLKERPFIQPNSPKEDACQKEYEKFIASLNTYADIYPLSQLKGNGLISLNSNEWLKYYVDYEHVGYAVLETGELLINVREHGKKVWIKVKDATGKTINRLFFYYQKDDRIKDGMTIEEIVSLIQEGE